MECLAVRVGGDAPDVAKPEGMESLCCGLFKVVVAYDDVGADLRGRECQKAW